MASQHSGDQLIELVEETAALFGSENEAMRKVIRSLALHLDGSIIDEFVVDFRIENEMEFPAEFHFMVEESLSDGIEEENPEG